MSDNESRGSQNEEEKMYVRYIGHKVCWTILGTGAFYFGEREEATENEIALCEKGGGELPLSRGIRLVSR